MDDYRKSGYNDELAKRIFLDRLEDCRYFPKYLTIETCNNCNARCIMCPKGQRGTKKPEIMDDGLFSKICGELKEYAGWIEMICLNSDGEPLLDKNLANRIRNLKESGIAHVNISTNAQLLTEDMANALMDAGLDDIRISLDAFKRDTYERIRVGLDFGQVVQNLENLIRIRDQRNSGMEIRVRLVELPENRDEIGEWKEYWLQRLRGGDKAQVMPSHTWSGAVTEESKKKIAYYADKPCVSVFSSMAINYDGRVQLCDSDVSQSGLIDGCNLNRSSISEIWRGEAFERARLLHASGRRNEIPICQGCDHWSRDFY